MRNRSPRAAGIFNMGKALQYRRLLALTWLLAVAFASLGYRLVDLQVLRHQDLGAKAQQKTPKGSSSWNHAGATSSTPKATSWPQAFL